jgi:hypothetical protein
MEKRIIIISMPVCSPSIFVSAWNKSPASGWLFIKTGSSKFRRFVDKIQQVLKLEK